MQQGEETGAKEVLSWQGSELRSSEFRQRQLMDLGSVLAGLGWPLMGAQTVWSGLGFAVRGCAPAAEVGERSEDLGRDQPRVAHNGLA